MRSSEFAPRVALLGVVMSGLAGCALEPGSPWGTIEPRLDVRLLLPAGRVDTDGRIRTVDDYRIALTELEITVDSLTFVAGESAALAFDPADPPAGYSLCHSGHCHSDDGRLVDYADIAAELAGGGSSGAPLVTLAGGDTMLTGADAEPVPLESCEGTCTVNEPVAVAVARVVVSGVRVTGTAFDARTGDAARLGPDGQTFDVSLDFQIDTVSLAVVLAESFGPGRVPGLRVRLDLEVGPSLFDNIPWPDAGSGGLDAALREAFRESVALALVDVSRFEL